MMAVSELHVFSLTTIQTVLKVFLQIQGELCETTCTDSNTTKHKPTAAARLRNSNYLNLIQNQTPESSMDEQSTTGFN